MAHSDPPTPPKDEAHAGEPPHAADAPDELAELRRRYAELQTREERARQLVIALLAASKKSWLTRRRNVHTLAEELANLYGLSPEEQLRLAVTPAQRPSQAAKRAATLLPQASAQTGKYLERRRRKQRRQPPSESP